MTRKPHDFGLWAEVAKSVRPLRHAKARRSAGAAAIAMEQPKPAPHVSAPHIHVPRTAPHGPPPITGFDRRTSQKMLRGNIDIERRLDLHGTGVELARERLYQFLARCRAEGVRTALVITGKGDSPFARHTLHGKAHFHTEERAGRLRRLVPDWLHESQFRALVSGFQPAHPKHGGGGAYYVRLRRIREHP